MVKSLQTMERIAKKLNANVYIAHPYSSWGRGTNENMIGLIRQFFPKKHIFVTITHQEIDFIM
jgi:IS30 family transposase